MGFLDNFKEAMKRGAEAAENYREREMAKAAQPSAVKPAPAAVNRTVNKPFDPNEAFEFAYSRETPIVINDPLTGVEVKFNLLYKGIAKYNDPSSYNGQDPREILKSALLEMVRSNLSDPSFLPNANDPKTLLMMSNRFAPLAKDVLMQNGFSGAFKMFVVSKEVSA